MENDNDNDQEPMDRLFSTTKNILEIMDEIQVKVAPLEDDYKDKVNAYETLELNIHSLKDSFCKKNINIETHEKMRHIITAKLNRILKLAELAYSLCQESSNEMKNRKSETKANNKMQTNNLSNYKLKQAEILGKIKGLRKKQEQFDKCKMKEINSMNEEYSGKMLFLKEEFQNVMKEIEQNEMNNIEKECVLNKRELAEKNEILQINEELEMTENYSFTTTKTIQDIENNYYKISEEEETLIKNIEEQYLLNQNKIEIKSTEIECISNDIQNIHYQIKLLEETTKTTNEERQKYLEETDHVNADIRINERNLENHIATYKDEICKKEHILSQINENSILEEVMSLKVETEILIRENSDITDYLNQNKELLQEDLMEQIYSIESDIQGIKLSLTKIKNDHEIKTRELNIRIKEVENEKVKLESNMKQRQEAISNSKNEIKQNKDKNTNIIELIKKENELLDSLEMKRKQWESKMCEKGAQKLKAPKNIPNKKPRMEPLPKRNPWDSDSSMEGIDSSFAARVARNTELKLQKKKPK